MRGGGGGVWGEGQGEGEVLKIVTWNETSHRGGFSQMEGYRERRNL